MGPYCFCSDVSYYSFSPEKRVVEKGAHVLETPNLVGRCSLCASPQAKKNYPDWPKGGAVEQQNTFCFITPKPKFLETKFFFS